MIRLYYVSKASDGVQTSDLEDILAKARANNRQVGITGLLVVKNGFFAQALEGEAQVVEELYRKIEQDPRHGGVVRITKTEVDERIFPSWDMGFRDLDDSLAAPQLRQVDLADQRFVTQPEELSIVFRSLVLN